MQVILRSTYTLPQIKNHIEIDMFHLLMVDRLIKTASGKKPKFHPNCLFLDWCGTEPNSISAHWCMSREMDFSKVRFSVTVPWKSLRADIIVATNYVGPPFMFEGRDASGYTNKSYLKSHLQKVIRRSNPTKAIKTAWHYLNLDMTDFLRRLAIIAVEDALPLEGYSAIIWFMVATSKGYNLSNEQICWLLGYVYDLALCKHYEQYAHDSAEIDPKNLRGIRLRSLSQSGRDTAYSILFRIPYGGMAGDRRMCRVTGELWAARYNSESRYVELLKRENKFVTPPTVPLKHSEWVIAAIDFHCCPNIVTAMWEKHDEYSEDQIREAIWHCSSSMTDKELLTEDRHQRDATDARMEVWKTIKKDFLSYAKFMLDKNG